MKEIEGNIWTYHEKGDWVVITTNGTIRKDGACVMGRGVAKQAAQMFPSLPYKLGRKLLVGGNIPYPFHDLKIITFPVKYHWRGKASLNLIEASCIELVKGMQPLDLPRLYMVRPGCGNGQLDWADVKKVLEKHLDDRFIIVERSP